MISNTAPSSYNFEEMYTDMGIKIGSMGCIMLDVNIPESFHPEDVGKDIFYSSPTLKWVTGRQDEGHVTLKYGLMPGTTKEQVDLVLSGWEAPPEVHISTIKVFPSPIEDEDYSCIVGALSLNDNPKILEAYRLLSFLPHVDTYMEYTPHVTLAYVRPKYLSRMVEWYLSKASRTSLETVDLNYGWEIASNTRRY